VRPTVHALGALGVLALDALVLLLGQVLELLGRLGLDLLRAGVGQRLRLLEQRGVRRVGDAAAVQRGARVALGGGAQLCPVTDGERAGAVAVAQRKARTRLRRERIDACERRRARRPMRSGELRPACALARARSAWRGGLRP
jgi:hypothetical protein